MSQSTTNHEYTFRDKATGEMRSITSIPGIPDIMVRIIQLPESTEGYRLRVQTGIAQKDDRISWKDLNTHVSYDLSEAEELFKTEKPTQAVTISREGLLFNFEEGFSETWRNRVVKEMGYQADSLDVPSFVISKPKVSYVVGGELPSGTRSITGTVMVKVFGVRSSNFEDTHGKSDPGLDRLADDPGEWVDLGSQ